MAISTLSFRIAEPLADEARRLATAAEISLSDYIRDAVREKNARMVAEHIAELSRALSADHQAEAETLAGTLGEGID